MKPEAEAEVLNGRLVEQVLASLGVLAPDPSVFLVDDPRRVPTELGRLNWFRS
jgi:hypothetical protein